MIELRGVCRFDITEELEMRDGFRNIRPDYSRFASDPYPDGELSIERKRLLSGLKGYFELQNIAADWDALQQTPDERLITTLAMVCPFDPAEKQVLLESPDIAQQCKLLIGFIETTLRADNDNGPSSVN
jgi:Lon protease-like protein